MADSAVPPATAAAKPPSLDKDTYGSTSKREDFSTAIAEAQAASALQAQAGDLSGAVETLLAVEKRTRMGGDSAATSRVAVAIVALCWEARDLRALNANILLIAKRRAQLKQAISDVVGAAMAYLEQLPSKADKLELITTLRTVTEGKIYVEVERARLTLALARAKEAEGRTAEASEIVQEVAIETAGSMEKREKAEFLLEQVRLTAAVGDWAKAGILANKMNKKVLDEAGFEDVRLAYYALLVRLHTARRDALALCKDYQAILATRGLGADAARWQPALESVIVFLALAPFDNEVSDLLHRVKTDKRTEDVPSFRALLTMLTTDEIIPWPLPAPHHAAIHAHAAFAGQSDDAPLAAAAPEGAAPLGVDAARPSGAIVSAIVRKEDEARSPWWPLLRKRVAQHNVRVVAKWYDVLRAGRLSQLLGLDAASTEAVVSELVSDKAVFCKIDRPSGTYSFQRPRPSAEILSDYAAEVDSVLALVERVSHLIAKEQMVHGVK